MEDHTFTSGAKRSEKMPRYDLIPARPNRRLALRYTMGVKYGEWNWYDGIRDREFVIDALNHLQAHLDKAKERISKGDMTFVDDDLAAVAWGAFAVMEAQEVCADDVRAAKHQSAKVPQAVRDLQERDRNIGATVQLRSTPDHSNVLGSGRTSDHAPATGIPELTLDYSCMEEGRKAE